MAKKYRTNINGAPILNVNFNGAPWAGNLKINGVEVSYDDTPAPPPPPPPPPVTTVWRLSAQPDLPATGFAWWSVGSLTEGPLRPRSTDGVFLIKDCYPLIGVSGSQYRAGVHIRRGYTPPTDGPAEAHLLEWTTNPNYLNFGWGKWADITSKSNA